MLPELTEPQIRRYARHIVLAEVGGVGQSRLIAARVLVVGAGGLGSPLALYLAAAGVGTVGLIDHDTLELSNLQRQVAHSTARLGRNKADSVAETLAGLNPEVRVEVHARRMDAEAARELIPRYDLVCDGTDNFATRFLLGDACHLLGRPLVSAAVLRFEGQLSVFRSHLGPPYPCHRCLHPEPPPDGLVPTCSEAGVLGSVTGVTVRKRASSASHSSSRPDSVSPMPRISFITSVACSVPITPVTAPSTPASEQLGTRPSGGGSGGRQRWQGCGAPRWPWKTESCPSKRSTAAETSGRPSRWQASPSRKRVAKLSVPSQTMS